MYRDPDEEDSLVQQKVSFEKLLEHVTEMCRVIIRFKSSGVGYEDDEVYLFLA